MGSEAKPTLRSTTSPGPNGNPRGPSERIRVRVTGQAAGGAWSGVLERDTGFKALRRGDVLSFVDADVVAVTTRFSRAVEAVVRLLARALS